MKRQNIHKSMLLTTKSTKSSQFLLLIGWTRFCFSKSKTEWTNFWYAGMNTNYQNESKRKSKFYGGYEQSSASSFYSVSFYFNDEIECHPMLVRSPWVVQKHSTQCCCLCVTHFLYVYLCCVMFFFIFCFYFGFWFWLAGLVALCPLTSEETFGFKIVGGGLVLN